MKHFNITVVADSESRLPDIAVKIAEAILTIETNLGYMTQTQINVQIMPIVAEGEARTTDAIGFRFEGGDGEDLYEDEDLEEYKRKSKTKRKGL